MSLNIKNPEAVQLARRLAATTGESMTRAVTVALQERLDRVRREERIDATDRTARLRLIARDAAGRWAQPYLRADHGDLLYDESGLPG